MATVFVTVFAGVLTFVVSQFVLKLYIEPVHELKKTIADVTLSLIEYSQIYSNPGVASVEVHKKVSEELLKLASRLYAQAGLILCYDITCKVTGLPPKKKVENAVKKLVSLSKGVVTEVPEGTLGRLVDANLKSVESIRSNLRIHLIDRGY